MTKILDSSRPLDDEIVSPVSQNPSTGLAPISFSLVATLRSAVYSRFIPMQSSIESILNGVVVIAVVLQLLNVFGLSHSLSRIHIGKG